MECHSEIAMIIVVASGLKVFDATCPLVTKVHVEVGKMRNQAREVVMIGHKGHPEVEGTMGQSAGGMVIVVRSPNTSNSRRLKEVAVARGIDGYLVDGPEEIEPAWLAGKQRIGVTAGASAPEILVARGGPRQCADRGRGWATGGGQGGRLVSSA
jgi:4-hydroxy-3-methylbut-2-enyl diphosphate reductase IspH